MRPRLPKDWHYERLDKLASVQTGVAKNSGLKGETVEVPYLRVANVQDGHIDLTELKTIRVLKRDIARFGLRENDIVVTEGGDFDKLGRGFLWHGQVEPCLHQNHVFAVRPEPARLLPEIFSFLTSSDYGRAYFMSCAKRSTNLASINSSQLKAFPVPLPPISEQRKITKILGTWDDALQTLERLIDAKDRRLRALRERLLFGKSRRSNPCTKLSHVAEEQSVRNRTQLDRTRLYAVTKADGMVPMRERVQGATINRCKVVERGWYAYNPMRLNIGSIARWEGKDPVMTSGDYVVFHTKEDRLLSDYLDQLRRSDAWANFVGGAGNGSVRIRIWFDDLGRFSFPLPPLAEQRRIANLLGAADTELRLLRRQRAALATQKRGLMQLLLTGKKRVRVS